MLERTRSSRLTVSGGVSYPIWENTKGSVDVLYGSDLRIGFANTTTVSPYTQVNLGLSHEFNLPDWKPFTLRFDVVNILDDVDLIRSGSASGCLRRNTGRGGVSLWASPKSFDACEWLSPKRIP